MERKLKIVSCLVFFLFLLINCTLNVEAINITTNNETYSGDSSYKKVTNTGNFKIYTSSNGSDKTVFRLYKVVDVYYNSSQDALKYQFTTIFQQFLNNSSYCPSKFRDLTIERYMTLNQGDAVRDDLNYYSGVEDSNVVSGGNLSSNDFAELMSEFAEYIRVQRIVSDATLSNFDRVNIPYVDGSSIPVGTYLALPTYNELNTFGATVFGVMVDSVRLEKNGSSWELKDAKILAKSSSSFLRHRIYVENTLSTYIDTSFNTSIEGKISFDIPTYPANAIDTAYRSITVTIDKVRDESGWLTFITSGFSTFDMSSTGGTIKYNNEIVGNVTRNNTTGQVVIEFRSISTLPRTIEFNYHAEKLNSTNSVMGPNRRTATLKFSDPYTASNDAAEKSSDSQSVTIYTYALQVTGTNGAEFKVTDSSGTAMGTVTIGNDGIGELKGLKSGTYTVTQTKAPAGYALLSGSQTIKVGNGGTSVSGKDGYYNITMRNSILAILPFTGSMGTLIFTIIGSLLIISSIVFIIRYKKKNKENRNATIN